MKTYFTIMVGIALASPLYGGVPTLNKTDEQSIHSMIKSVLNNTFQLGTKQYTSKKLKLELSKQLPEKLYFEDGIRTKEEYMHFLTYAGQSDKDILIKAKNTIEIKSCFYIDNTSVDCNVKESEEETYVGSSSVSSGYRDLKINFTLSDTGDWSMHSIRSYSILPLPTLNSIELEKKELQEQFAPKVVLEPEFDDTNHAPIKGPSSPEEYEEMMKKKPNDPEISDDE